MKLDELLKSIQDLNISKVVEYLETHPEGIGNGEDPDTVVNWMYDFKDEVMEEMLKVKGKVEIQKSFSHSGFEKMKLPYFKGEIMEFYSFKSRWEKEVHPEGCM